MYQKFSWKKLLKFFSCTYFWSIVVLIFAITSFGLSNISPGLIKKSLIPFTPVNWFARAYLHLYIIFPLLNKVIYKFDKKVIGYIIGALTLFFYVIPTIRNVALGGYLNSLLMFSNMYFIGAYIRLYANKEMERYMIRGGILGIAVIYSSILFFILTGCIKKEIMSYPSSGANLFVLLVSIGMFVYFKNKQISYSNIINNVAATTFAVYLIHDNELLKSWLWNDVVRSQDFYSSSYLILHMLMASVSIFVVCSFLDYLRIKYFEKPIMKLVR